MDAVLPAINVGIVPHYQPKDSLILERSRDKYSMGEYGLYSQFEVDIHAGLDHVAPATRADRSTYEVAIFMYCEEYDFASVALVAQAPRNLDATARPHGDVQDNEVRSQVFDFRTNRISVGNCADDLIVVLKNIGYVIEDSWIIVHHQNARPRRLLVSIAHRVQHGQGLRVCAQWTPSIVVTQADVILTTPYSAISLPAYCQ